MTMPVLNGVGNSLTALFFEFKTDPINAFTYGFTAQLIQEKVGGVPGFLCGLLGGAFAPVLLNGHRDGFTVKHMVILTAGTLLTNGVMLGHWPWCTQSNSA